MEYRVTHLYTYPLKSGMGTNVDSIEVLSSGLMYDRFTAVIDSKDRIVTGRNFPKLLLLSASIDSQFLVIKGPIEQVTFRIPDSGTRKNLRLFRNRISGIEFSNKAHNWISGFLDGDFRLVHIGKELRPVSLDRGGRPGEHTAFADSAPVHLISQSSLDSLNGKLKKDVGIENFRPNIVISGGEAFEEDNWSSIEIKDISFRVLEKTQRCIFTTINPKTLLGNPAMEPLASIAKHRLKKGARPTFGINLIPLSEGSVNIGDHLKITT